MLKLKLNNRNRNLPHKEKKQKGYILAFVLVMSFFMVTLIAATFTVAFRYMKMAERNIKDLNYGLAGDIYKTDEPAPDEPAPDEPAPDGSNTEDNNGN